MRSGKLLSISVTTSDGHENNTYKKIETHKPLKELVSGLTKLKFLLQVLKLFNSIVFLKYANPV